MHLILIDIKQHMTDIDGTSLQIVKIFLQKLCLKTQLLFQLAPPSPKC